MVMPTPSQQPDTTKLSTPDNQVPMVSVIMPIRNEAAYIMASLGAILSQDYPHSRLEVLIADGLSTDSTREKITELAAGSDVRIRIIDNPKKIVPTGFNLALAAATGDVIIRVDGHTIIAANYVRECVTTLERSAADNVGGTMNAISTTPVGQSIALATSSPFGVGGSRFHYSHQEEWVDSVYMGAWPRSLFDRVGTFDEEFVRNQDDEFNYRLSSMGGKILLNPRIQSKYYNRSSLKSLAKQYFQYGVYKVRVMQKHPGQMSIRHFIPLLFVAAFLFGAILSPVSQPIRVLWLVTIGLYICADLAFSLRLASKHGWPQLSRLPFIFLLLHVSYGSGFGVGLIRFSNRWRS